MAHRPQASPLHGGGDRYFEYTGEVPAFQSGIAFCAKCAPVYWGEYIESPPAEPQG